MTETELERLIVRIVGDSSQYTKVLKGAEQQTLTSARGMANAMSKSAPSVGSDGADALGKIGPSLEEAHGHSAKLGMSLRDTRHALHLLAVAPGLEHISHPAMMGVYAYHLLGERIKEAAMSLGGFNLGLAAGGIGAVIAGVSVLAYAIHKTNENLKEAGESAKSTFDEVLSGSMTAAAGIEDSLTRSLKKGLGKVAEESATPKFFGAIEGFGEQITGMPLGTEKVMQEVIDKASLAQSLYERMLKIPHMREQMAVVEGNEMVSSLDKQIDKLKLETSTKLMSSDAAKIASLYHDLERKGVEQGTDAYDKAAKKIEEYKESLAEAGEVDISEKLLESSRALQKLGHGSAYAERAGVALERMSKHGGTFAYWMSKLEPMKLDQMAAGLIKLADKNKEMAIDVEKSRIELEQGSDAADRYSEIAKYAADQNISFAEAERKLAGEMEKRKKLQNELAAIKIEKKIRDMEREAALVGKGVVVTAQAKMVQDEMNRTGETAAQVQARLAHQLERVAEAKRLELRGGVEDRVRNLEDEAARIGLTAEASERLAVVQKYAHDANVDMLTAIQQLAPQLNRMADAQDRLSANKLWESTRTPMENYAIKIREINRLAESGYLDQNLYARALAKTRKETLGASQATETFQQTSFGSAEAISRMQQQQDRLSDTTATQAQLGRAAANVGQGPIQQVGAGGAAALGKLDQQGVPLLDRIAKACERMAVGGGIGGQVGPALQVANVGGP